MTLALPETSPLFGQAKRDEGTTKRAPLATVGLFSGIGGLELGLARAGHRTLLLCENDGVARAVLDDRFPEIAKHDDVRTLRTLPKGTELVAAGFPCQDLSQAGRTAGIEGEKSGLISEVFRLLRRRRVPWLLLENVPFMLHVKKGAAFEFVIRSLEELGYRWAYRVIDSRAFGLPQRRERVFLVASLDEDPRTALLSDDEGLPTTGETGTQAVGFYWTEGNKGLGWAVDAIPTLKRGSALGIASPPGILLPNGEIVKPDIRDAERMQGFPANWTLAAKGNHGGRKTRRWGLVGNAVTVDVAEWIGKRLRKPRAYIDWGDRSLKAGTMWPRAGWGMDGKRYASAMSAWPVRRSCASLEAFLRYPGEPLSEKATAGFLSRVRASTLRIPDGFIDSLAAHLERIRVPARP